MNVHTSPGLGILSNIFSFHNYAGYISMDLPDYRHYVTNCLCATSESVAKGGT